MHGSPRARAEAAGVAAALVFVILAAIAGRARAAEPELALTWLAPAGCPTPAEVEAQFVRLIGGASRLPSGKHIDASAAVRTSAADRWTLELSTTLDGAPGRRTLAGDSCASVSSAAALILALMVDPAAAERALLAPPPPGKTEAPAAPAAAGPPVVVATPQPEPRALHAYARLFGGAFVSVLPSPAPAAGAALGVRRRRLAAELSFVATDQQHVTASGGNANPASGDFRLLVGGARGCGTLGGHVVVWQLCAGGELEWLTGKGLVRPGETETGLMGAGTAGVLVTVPLGARFGLSLDVDGALRPYHPTFCAFCGMMMMQPGTPIVRVPLASAFAALGLFLTI
jgi:hypothetical protein